MQKSAKKQQCYYLMAFLIKKIVHFWRFFKKLIRNQWSCLEILFLCLGNCLALRSLAYISTGIIFKYIIICRDNETEEERSVRLEKLRVRARERRKEETPQQTADRIKKQSEINQEKIANETPQQRKIRLERNRLRDQAKIANETPQQRKIRLERDRLKHQSRLLMDPGKLEAIRKKARLRKRALPYKQR